jgi:putative RecB family exonuclease
VGAPVTPLTPAEGAAGPDAVPRRPALSPSRAADFTLCPLLYRFRAIDRLPETPGPAQVRGTLVHAVLERLFDLPATERLPGAARALVAPAWADLCAAEPGLPAALFGEGAAAPGGAAVADVAAETARSPDPAQAWLAGVDPLLDAYFALEDPRLLEPQAREQLVEVELESGLLLRGYVDRIDAAGADYRVVDYKTGTAPGPAVEARALFQMKFYALVLLLLRGSAPRELCLMYLTGPATLHYVPDAEQLLRFGRTLEAMWTAIRSAGATGDFRPNPGPSCAWCSHRALCPAWDGVPPPYPGWPTDPGVAGADPPDRATEEG